MTIWWCAGCGMEDTRAHTACPSCGSALQVGDVDWLSEHDPHSQTTFELEMEPVERAAIVEGLVSAGIMHRWDENSELVVQDDDADEVDSILDEVLGADTRDDDDDNGEYDADIDLDDADDTDDDDDDHHDDGGNYSVLSDLFAATDRLQKRREDENVADFLAATGVALVTAQPLGVDEETWADIQSGARNLAAALEADSKAHVDAEIKALLNELRQMV
jgi:hypothetical protein